MAPLSTLLILLLWYTASAAGDRLATSGGDEIPIDIEAADGDRLLLWLPSEFGGTPRRRVLAANLAGQGIEVWSPDLHAAWFLPAGRHSLDAIAPGAIAELIQAAIARSGKRVYLMAEGRSVALALAGVRAWQQAADGTSALAGLLAFSPKLYVRTPQGGAAAEFLPIAGASNLPIYVLQPEASGGHWRIGDVARELEAGGSPVFLRHLPRVSDGFHTRPEVSDAEVAMTRRLPDMLRQAMYQLDAYGGTPPRPAPIRRGPGAPQQTDTATLLHPFPEPRPAPPLRLPGLGGSPVDLANLRGRVVLVNFWASWCPPCVAEIPSLQRLYAHLAPAGLAILAVDVGESAATVERFLQDKAVDFPVLIDRDATALRHWQVYAFPTTLILDRDHCIRYAVYGAFDWASPEVVAALRPLLDGR